MKMDIFMKNVSTVLLAITPLFIEFGFHIIFNGSLYQHHRGLAEEKKIYW